MKAEKSRFKQQELDSLFIKLKSVNKSISIEIEKIKILQEEVAFSVVKTQCKVQDRVEILQSISGLLIKEISE